MLFQNRRFYLFTQDRHLMAVLCVMKNRADNRILICALSALRLCVWLFDNCGIQLLYID